MLTPVDSDLEVEIRGNLAGTLTIAANAKGRPFRDGLLWVFDLVAGTRNQRDHKSWIAEI